MSLAMRLRLRRKNDLWVKGSSAVAILAVFWLIAIFLMPVIIAATALAKSNPATLTSALDTGTFTILLVGIGLLVLPRCRHKLLRFHQLWMRQDHQGHPRAKHPTNARHA